MKKLYVKIVNSLLSVLCAATLCFSFFGCTPRTTPGDTTDPTEPTTPIEPEIPPWSTTYDLPDADGAMQKLVGIYGGESKIFLLQNGHIARMPCPRGEVISLNLRYEADDYVRLILEDCVNEFNEVFAVINPNYVFRINYSPTDEDFAAKYSVRMSKADELASSDVREVFGLAHISYYNNFTELGDFGITMRSDVFENGSYLMTTFKHELMHLLGAGDAYNNPDATKATIMQSYTLSGYRFFSETDVRFLDALYRNPKTPYTDEQIEKFITDYEQTCTHTQSALTAATYKLLLNKTTAASITAQAQQIGYSDVSGFTAALENGFIRDETFGTANISFTELAYTVAPEATYYGSFDIAAARYWHGQQKGLMGNSQGIKYVDYGDGVLYAAPNGNIFTILIKVDGYVILFDLLGSFTSLPNLGLSVRTVCSVK